MNFLNHKTHCIDTEFIKNKKNSKGNNMKYGTATRITKKGTGKTYYGEVAQHGMGWTTLILINDRGVKDIRRFSWRAHIIRIGKDME